MRLLTTLGVTGLALMASVLTVPALAQSASFDGTYHSTSITGGGGRGTTTCATITSMTMTITGGRVVIREVQAVGTGPTYQGTVDPSGKVDASYTSGSNRSDAGGLVSSVTGTISGGTFTGQRAHQQCRSNVTMTKS
jgi:hypothetical protein